MEGKIERTFIALKPDAVQRGIVGEVMDRLERAGLRIAALKMVQASDEVLEEHYSEHVDKDFYDSLAEFMKEGPVIAGVVEGVEAVAVVRKIVGATEPYEAAPGTIRGDFSHMSMEHADERGKAVKNIIHAAGNPEEAEEEISIWFDEEEIHQYERVDDFHIA
ncbi:MAG: nucleoside-diphosphate kinase [Candidatus Nanohaloarchaeota archaeon QJJ-7]|nr:nucleoside-diphosphate kinase [Candidatus Nanohaloarchaeota archaeon QJJ-7]